MLRDIYYCVGKQKLRGISDMDDKIKFFKGFKEPYLFDTNNPIVDKCKSINEVFIDNVNNVANQLNHIKVEVCLNMENINILYKNKEMSKLEKIERGDWVDLRCNSVSVVTTRFAIGVGEIPILTRTSERRELPFETGIFEGEEVQFVRYDKGDYLLINLGFAMELPEGYEAYVIPRGSTLKNYGLIQPNSPGVVDNTFCGDDDVWFMPALAQKDGFMIFNERICQFRIQKKMPESNFNPVEELGNENRGSYSSTGTK